MKFGVCYYPEHWPEARWEEDARWLRELGITIVRLAEFAWSRLEPEEGRFDFGWLDRAVELFARQGFQIVLGTPTAAPPVWLSTLYPSTLPVDEQGRQRNYGGRRHYCPNNVVYREHTQRIVTAMAERYGRSEHVIGWQIDNEFGGGNTARCYCPNCAAAFRVWLEKRYGKLAALNEAWGTVFWSAEFDDWSQIGPPILNLARPNPAHVLDYYRFSSDSVVDYQQSQISILKSSIIHHQFITHNFMGLYPDLNYFDLAQPLDFVTWDSYPTGNAYRWREMLYGDEKPASFVFAQDKPFVSAQDRPFAFDVGDPYITAFAHDLTRGLKPGRPFWIMEQQPGHINWGAVNTLVRPGTVRLWVWHAVMSGADAVVYFRERAARHAQEKYHAGLQHHDGSPDVGALDQRRLWAERELLERLTAHPPQAQVALLWSYDDLWALQLEPHTRDFTYLRHLFVYYRALRRLGIPVDIVAPNSPISNYNLLLVPTFHLVNSSLAQKLTDYVRAGGNLLLGVRSGFKTPANSVSAEPLPGVLRDLVGATVTDWGALPAGVGFEVESDIAGLSGKATLWVESLVPISHLQSLAVYRSGPYASRAALTENRLTSLPQGEGSGVRGRVWYCGWFPTLDQAAALLRHLAAELSLARLADDLPTGLLAARRGPHTVLLNFTDEPLTAQVQGQTITVAGRDAAFA
jgi:beta-galactosidase